MNYLSTTQKSIIGHNDLEAWFTTVNKALQYKEFGVFQYNHTLNTFNQSSVSNSFQPTKTVKQM